MATAQAALPRDTTPARERILPGLRAGVPYGVASLFLGV
jgi:hypothetical protein